MYHLKGRILLRFHVYRSLLYPTFLHSMSPLTPAQPQECCQSPLFASPGSSYERKTNVSFVRVARLTYHDDMSLYLFFYKRLISCL